MGLEKYKVYRMTKFPPEVLASALSAFQSAGGGELRRASSEVQVGDEGWHFDNDAEFYALYRDPKAWYSVFGFASDAKIGHRIRVIFKDDYTTVHVSLHDRTAIESVFEVFEAK